MTLRLLLGAALCAAVAAGSAAAQSNAQRASALNDEGKAAMQGGNFALASERFNQAILLSREGRFYFNLCVSLYQEGKLSDSLAACKAVEAAGADAKLNEKTTKMVGKVKDDMRKAGFDPDAPPPPIEDPQKPPIEDPNKPPIEDPNKPPIAMPNIVQPPPASVITATAAAPTHSYTWTLGAEVFGGNGVFGPDERYTKATFGFRVVGDYLLAPAKKLGAQASIGVLHANRDGNAGTESIDVVDVGLAGYKHLCGGRTCFTPLLGASLGLMQPEGVSGNDALLAVGLRAEGRVGFALGKRFEHLLSISAGLQAYTRAFDSGSITAESLGLDGMSRVFLVAIGYTYRFNTPFGSSPFVTLE